MRDVSWFRSHIVRPLPNSFGDRLSVRLPRKETGRHEAHSEETTMWCSAVGCIMMLTLSLLAAPLAAEAPPPGKVYRIGYLATIPPPAHLWAALLDGLREHGYSEGRNLVFERRFSEGNAERFPAF